MQWQEGPALLIHVLWKSLPTASLSSMGHKSGSSMLPLPALQASRDAERQEDGIFKMASTQDKQDLPARMCQVRPKSHHSGRKDSDAKVLFPHRHNRSRRSCLLSVATTDQLASTQWRNGWRRAPPGRQPISWLRKKCCNSTQTPCRCMLGDFPDSVSFFIFIL